MATEIGTLHVRRSGLIAASPARVWEEFTTFERLSAWFGRGHRLETYVPQVGGEVLLSVEIDGERRTFGGAILVFDPGLELTFSNNWTERGWRVPTTLTLRLQALGAACHVELIHHGFERLGASAGTELEGYESGWHSRHLEALKSIVERS